MIFVLFSFRLGSSCTELTQQASGPLELAQRHADGHVLRLGRRQRHGGLLLAAPAQRAAAEQQHHEASGRLARVLAARPVGVAERRHGHAESNFTQRCLLRHHTCAEEIFARQIR